MHENSARISATNAPAPAPRGQRYLGMYLFALCVYQFGIYQWPGGPPFVLDPRGGIAVLLINHFLADNKVILPVQWISLAWLAFAAVMLLLRRRFLKVYVVSEILLAAPTAYYIGVLAVLHGGDFAPAFQDLVITLCFFLAYSAIPVFAAVWMLRRAKAEAGRS